MFKILADEEKKRAMELEKKAKEKREIEKQKNPPVIGSKPKVDDYYQWKKVDYEGKMSIDCMKESTNRECSSPNFKFEAFLNLYFPKLIFFIFIGSVTSK